MQAACIDEPWIEPDRRQRVSKWFVLVRRPINPAVIRLQRVTLRFSLRMLVGFTLVVAFTFAAYTHAPTLTLSIILLAPTPLLIAAVAMPRLRVKRRLLAVVTPFALFAFHIGLLGPLTAMALMPKEWGLVEERGAIVAYVNRGYPTHLLERLPDAVSDTLVRYQTGWGSLVAPEMYPTLEDDVSLIRDGFFGADGLDNTFVA